MANNPTQLNAVIQSGYDQIADKYLAWTENRPSPRIRYVEKLLDQIALSLSDNFTLLELGCGAGVPVTKYLASHPRVEKVFANDISTRQLELARERVAGTRADVTFLSGDMASLHFEEGTFQGVVAFFSLIHLPRAAQRTTLEKIYSWLRPGGYLACNFGAGKAGQHSQSQHPVEQREGALDSFLGVPMYWEESDSEGSLALVRQAGLEVVEHEILDATDGQEVLDPSDPDSGSMFLWMVARKPPSRG